MWFQLQANTYTISTDHKHFWSIIEVNGATFTRINFTQPNSSILRLKLDTLTPFKHVVCLLLQHQYDDQDYSEDCIVIQIKLPDLSPSVWYIGYEAVTGVLNFRFSASDRDPANGLSAVANHALYCHWTAKRMSLYHLSYKAIHAYMDKFTLDTNTTATDCQNEYTFTSNTTDLSLIVTFTVLKGPRTSHAHTFINTRVRDTVTETVRVR